MDHTRFLSGWLMMISGVLCGAGIGLTLWGFGHLGGMYLGPLLSGAMAGYGLCGMIAAYACFPPAQT